jgi:hypothetical protein
MREKPSQTALFLLSVALLAPAASAHPLKTAHAPATARKTSPAADPVRVSSRGRAIQSPRIERVEARHAAKSSARLPERRGPERRTSERQPFERKAADVRGEERSTGKRRQAQARVPARVAARVQNRGLNRIPDRRASDARVEEPKANRGRRPEPVEQARIMPRVEPPAPEAAAVELPPIEVHHNRKIHLTPEPTATGPDAAPRKATVEDFLDAPAVPANNKASNPAPAPKAAVPAPAAPAVHPVSIVERKLPALPVVKAASAVIPNPVIPNPVLPNPVLDPVLYTARGHLIVPPAMKGSHEILLHQNEMADNEGLTRVQDDDDLEKLRAARQLVALPASAALEIDERLPVNRRYCRPWTAQFLAAMARAHYARFHSPLQVNSAVRTVEFQARLRYTNGNAAPAEGETASPHLTGQAVDLAKHGLSMTEIAWMRGYLMPLVQQGKVDVEEEFQQACFHISVYKKYLPQPAPKREIQPRRSPASALATAIR